ncbi:hypothetical protein JTE90_001789 [Oedothorax gibbosus]|uniref:Uncharacterized protein n=1 Tax=Oedothorax gibbosus TaxID=931172 RepID=A0AAV6VQU3_9ARAC|nr:hypothetical protein JTE90_001789 [Oedothorax gibbosus]
MASTPLLGSKINLISKSEIRYEGILYTFDTKESTVALTEVRSFGTEDRPTERPVAPKDEVYEYIIFRANQIKDLHVCESPAHFSLHCDPAIVKHSQPVSVSNYSQHFGSGIPSFPHASSQSSYVPISHVLSSSHYSGASRSVAPSLKKSPTSDAGVQTSVGRVESGYRNDGREPLRQQNREQNQSSIQNRRRGPSQNRQPINRRGVPRRGRRSSSTSVERFKNEYDFEQANAEFKELENKFIKNTQDDSKTESTSDKEDTSGAYNKKESFFDKISCESTERSNGSPRFDWRYEQKLNVETFGVSANNNWLRRRRARGGYRRGYRGRGGYNRQNVEVPVPAPKTVTFDDTPVVKEVEIVTLEEKPEPLPVIEVIAETEKKDWPEPEVKPEVWTN